MFLIATAVLGLGLVVLLEPESKALPVPLPLLGYQPTIVDNKKIIDNTVKLSKVVVFASS